MAARSTFAVWGSGTGVGKTLVGAGLAAAARRAGLSALYLKPVQTGFPSDADAQLVAQLAGGWHTLGAHAAELVVGREATAALAAHGGPECRTLFAWRAPIGPHLAARREGRTVSDAELLSAVRDALRPPSAVDIAFVETAGGVASPGPSGALQCDLLSPLALPAVLVGDGRLGGVSATICAYEALASRGAAVAAVVLLDGGLENEDALRAHLPAPVHLLPPPPPPPADGRTGEPALQAWIDELSRPVGVHFGGGGGASAAMGGSLAALLGQLMTPRAVV